MKCQWAEDIGTRCDKPASYNMRLDNEQYAKLCAKHKQTAQEKWPEYEYKKIRKLEKSK